LGHLISDYLFHGLPHLWGFGVFAFSLSMCPAQCVARRWVGFFYVMALAIVGSMAIVIAYNV